MSQDFTPLTEQRRRLVANRLATVVSIGEDLLTVLDSPLHSTIEDLLTALATLTTLTDPNRSDDWQRGTSRSANTPPPDFTPAWASHKLTQIDRVLYELAGNITAWTHHPSNTHRPDRCDKCGRNRSKDDLYCRQCGTPTLHAYRRCWVRACPNRGGQRQHCPPDIPHPKQGGTVPPVNDPEANQ